MSSKYVINGFKFSSEEEYNIAYEDYEAISFFMEKADLSDPDSIYKLYNRLIERNTFQTIVGYSYLKDLQDKIIEAEYKTLDQLEEIPVENFIEPSENIEAVSLEHYKELSQTNKEKHVNARVINIILTIVIVIMFIIALQADKTVFTQFEQDMVDKYAAWEEELTERENQLIEKGISIED